jgi:hypothetical protein
MKNLHKLLKGAHEFGLTDVCFKKYRPCATCQTGKQVGTTHTSKNVMTTSRPLELLHMDLFRTAAYLNIEGSMVLLLLINIPVSLRYSFCRINLKPKNPQVLLKAGSK